MSLSTPRASQPQVDEITFASYGVRVAVRTDERSLVPFLDNLVPPVHGPADPRDIDNRFVFTRSDEGLYNVHYMRWAGKEVDAANINGVVAKNVDLDLAIALLQAQVHSSIAQEAPGHVFINAAVVEHRGSAIVLAGRGMSGRTTLAVALIEEGATFYSDMYAVLDAHGRVHPYLAPPEILAAAPADGLPLGAILFSNYAPGASWELRSLSRGQCVVELLAHTVNAQIRPEQSLQAVNAALASGPAMLRSDRGEAAATAPLLLSALDRDTAA